MKLVIVVDVAGVDPARANPHEAAVSLLELGTRYRSDGRYAVHLPGEDVPVLVQFLDAEWSA